MYNNPLTLEEREYTVDRGDLAAGLKPVIAKIRVPIWYQRPDTELMGGRPTRAAFEHVRDIAQPWCAAHPASAPPVVIHLTDGESTDGDPEAAARELLSLATSAGNLLLFNLHLSSLPRKETAFPIEEGELDDPYGKTLFRISSKVPSNLPTTEESIAEDVRPDSRLMAYNCAFDVVKIIKLIRIFLPVSPGTVGTQKPTDSPGAQSELPPVRETAPGLDLPKLDEIQFTVYRPRVVRPDVWYPMLAFAHIAERRPDSPENDPDPIEQVRVQAEQILGARAKEFRDTSVDARQAVPRAAEITLQPYAPGVEFNPDRRTFRWMKDVHREEFDLRASSVLDGTTARGRLSAYLGAILLAEVEFAIKVDSSHSSRAAGEPQETAAARPYHKIFASYSHKDIEIVRQYENFVQTLGDQYLRDVRDLRSGQDWDEALCRLIDQADVFQLFWSTNSMRSPFVRREWEYALSLGRDSFIRPTYWENPFPESPDPPLPPDELKRLHFHCLGIPGQSTAGPTLTTESDRHSTADEGATERTQGATAGPTRPGTAVLKIVAGRRAGQIFELKGDRVVIGRSPDCQVMLDSNGVSRKHAEIYRKGDDFYLADLNARNETVVNLTKVIPGIDRQLASGDRIRIFDFEFLFYPRLPSDSPATQAADDMIIKEGEIEESAELHRNVGWHSNASESTVKPEIKLKAILDIARNLASEPKIDALAPSVVDSLMDVFPQAEHLSLSLVEPETNRLVPKAFKHRPQKRASFGRTLPQDEVPASISRSMFNVVFNNKKAVLFQDASEDKFLPSSASISDLKIRSVMCAPILTPDNKVLGMIQIDTSNGRTFNEDDLGVLAAVASQAAIAIQNAQMHESLLVREQVSRDLKLAEQMQKRFLPQSVPIIAGYEFFAHYEPAYDVGGDYYDFLPLPNNRLAVAVGDVSGLGISSAMMMTYCSLTTRSCILAENAPAQAANELNRRLCSAAIADTFTTLILGVLDVPNRILSLISAGHPPALIRRASGKVDEIGADIMGFPLSRNAQ